MRASTKRIEKTVSRRIWFKSLGRKRRRKAKRMIRIISPALPRKLKLFSKSSGKNRIKEMTIRNPKKRKRKTETELKKGK